MRKKIRENSIWFDLESGELRLVRGIGFGEMYPDCWAAWGPNPFTHYFIPEECFGNTVIYIGEL